MSRVSSNLFHGEVVLRQYSEHKAEQQEQEHWCSPEFLDYTTN